MAIRDPEPWTGVDATGRRFAEARRSATLATVAPDGMPRLVPICFVLADVEGDGPGTIVYSPLDEKPKRSADVRRLARVRDIADRPEVALLFERWSEDWDRLAWLRVRGLATLLEPHGAGAAEHRSAVAMLRRKYPPYVGQRIDARPMVRVLLTASTSWGVLQE